MTLFRQWPVFLAHVIVCSGVRYAYQALALDEQRASFAPSIWKLPPTNRTTKLCQCWFPGVHINIGGGSSTKPSKEGDQPQTDREQLAYISYAWMLDRIRPHLALDEGELESQKREILAASVQDHSHSASNDPANGEQTVTTKPSVGAWYNPATWFRMMKQHIAGMPRMSAIGYAAGEIPNSHTLFYDLMAAPKPRIPVNLSEKEIADRVFTTERVHPSVFYRQEFQRIQGLAAKDLYDPVALRGWERRLVKGGDHHPRTGFQWVKYKPGTGTGAERVVEKVMWEFEIGHMPADKSVERWLIDQSWCESVHKEVDSAWRSS